MNYIISKMCIHVCTQDFYTSCLLLVLEKSISDAGNGVRVIDDEVEGANQEFGSDVQATSFFIFTTA